MPDGVRGVPAVPAVKVQVPEPSGCRHYTEVVSAKHQVQDLLCMHFFFALCRNVRPKTCVTSLFSLLYLYVCVSVYVLRVCVCMCVCV